MKARLELENPLQDDSPHDGQNGVGGQLEVSVICHVTHFIGQLTLSPVSSRVNDPRQQVINCASFYNLVPEATHHHMFY